MNTLLIQESDDSGESVLPNHRNQGAIFSGDKGNKPHMPKNGHVR